MGKSVHYLVRNSAGTVHAGTIPTMPSRLSSRSVHEILERVLTQEQLWVLGCSLVAIIVMLRKICGGEGVHCKFSGWLPCVRHEEQDRHGVGHVDGAYSQNKRSLMFPRRRNHVIF